MRHLQQCRREQYQNQITTKAMLTTVSALLQTLLYWFVPMLLRSVFISE